MIAHGDRGGATCWQKWTMAPLGPNKITGIYARLEPISCTPRLEGERNAAIADPRPGRPPSPAEMASAVFLFSSSAFYPRRTTHFMIRLVVQILVKMTYQAPRICVHFEHLYLGKIPPLQFIPSSAIDYITILLKQ